MTAPCRVQRQRTAGWRMPDGAVYVGRPSPWGNPYTVGAWDPGYLGTHQVVCSDDPASHIRSAARAVEAYAEHVAPWLDVEPLRGHDLVCWCRLDQPCHADVLLRLANGDTP
jgi:hypothetical protein